jgi:molybdenum cofactor cytidylyltransferase
VTTSALVLAAGGSARMGRPKQLLRVDGRPLLERVLVEVNRSRVDDVTVVLGGHAEKVTAAVDFGRAHWFINAAYRTGMSSSLKAGVAALGPGVARVIIILGDQPDVTALLIDDLLDLQASSGRPAAALQFNQLLHPPVVLERALWPGLDSLQGDVGCRALIRQRPDQVPTLPMAESSAHPIDIDTLEDYRRLVGNQTG